MDYGAFQRHGEVTWDRMQVLLEGTRVKGIAGLSYEQLEELAATHRRIVSDFAYARTHFAGSVAERRLRSLAFSGHRLLGSRPEPFWPRVREFILRGFPRRFRASAPTLVTALSIFCASTALGGIVTLLNPDFAAVFVGQQRVDEVREGILWTDQIATAVPSSYLSAAIFTNNMSVALLAWAGGALFGLISTYVLILNGAMFGSILMLVWQAGLFGRLGDFISAHGPLELSLIVVAAAAGLEMARGQLTTDNSPRTSSFKAAGRRSLQLAVGTLPLLVMLGVVEGFISPSPDIPTMVKVVIGFALLSLFLIYVLLMGREQTEIDSDLDRVEDHA